MKEFKVNTFNDHINESLSNVGSRGAKEIIEMVSDDGFIPRNKENKTLIKELRKLKYTITIIQDSDIGVVIFKPRGDETWTKEFYMVYANTNYEFEEMFRITKIKLR